MALIRANYKRGFLGSILYAESHGEECLFASGFESGSTGEWDNVTGTPTIQGTVKNSGSYSMYCDSISGVSKYNTIGNVTRVSFYYRFKSVEPSTVYFTRILGDLSAGSVNVRITKEGYISLFAVNHFLDQTLISENQWYRISVSINSSTNVIKLYINGEEKMSEVIAGVVSVRPELGMLSKPYGMAMWFDDFGCDTTSSTEDLGNVQILNEGGSYTYSYDTMELQENEYMSAEQDRNIPMIAGEKLALAIWGRAYSIPNTAPDREIVWCEWSGIDWIFNIIQRGAENTIINLHMYGDNVALLWSSSMNWDVCIFKDMLEDIIGSIGYTNDVDGDGEMELPALQPDDETFTDKDGNIYNKILITQGNNLPPIWMWSWDVGGEKPPT